MRSVALTVPVRYAGVKYVISIPAARAGIVTARLAVMATAATTANNLLFFTYFSSSYLNRVLIGEHPFLAFDHPVQNESLLIRSKPFSL